MSLVNDKLFDINSIKPKQIDEFIHNEHLNIKSASELKNSCPACLSNEYKFAFDKYNFHYVQCKKCMSLYVQNRVSKENLEIYNQSLETNIYSSKQYSEYLQQLLEANNFDIELMYTRIFGNKQNIKIGYLGSKKLVFEKSLAKFDIEIESFKITTNKDSFYDFIILDHALEKMDDLFNFLNLSNKALKKDGYIYILARVGSGIDILTLWEKSKVYPLEHQNLLSIDGLKILLNNIGFHIKEINTPGTLDVDNILKNKSEIPKFLEYIRLFNNDRALEDFRIFIQKNLLSSFATIIAKKEK